MKHIYNLMGVLCLISLQVIAQDFAPVGAEWTLGFKTYGLTPSPDLFDAYKTVKITHEEMKEGKLCRVIEGDIQPHGPNGGIVNYVYNENNAVYAWFEQEQHFQEVFDFSAEVGDSWDILVSEDLSADLIIDTFRVHVDSVYIELLDGESTNSYRYSLEYLAHDSTMCPTFNYSAVDLVANSKLGSGYYILPVINLLCVIDPYPMNESYQTVRCYSDADINYSNLGSIPFCDYFNLSANDIVDHGTSIQINKTSVDIISEKETDYALTLYTLKGQILKATRQTTSLDISGIQEGLYILQVQNNDINISHKIKL